MRLIIDIDRCQGHSRCRALAPDLVSADVLGHAIVVHTEPLSANDFERAALLVANCPEGAIHLRDDGSRA